MDNSQYFRSLLEFHSWRQEKISALIQSIDSSWMTKELNGSFGSLYIVLNHLVWAEKVWFSRVKKNTTASMPEQGLTVEILLTEWNKISSDWLNLVQSKSIAEFEETYTYYSTQGEKFENPLCEIIIHLVDHSTYHIGQMMNAIRGFGLEPVQTNYIHYLRTLTLKEA